MILSGEALLEFRSSERRCFWRVSQVYKHFTPTGVKRSRAMTFNSNIFSLLQNERSCYMNGGKNRRGLFGYQTKN